MTEAEAQYIRKLEKEVKDLKEQNASQYSMYEMTTIYLKKIQDDLKSSQQKILNINRSLTSSINYARYIQDAFVVRTDILQKIFTNSFIFQKPKDIVSGDFVWAFENDNKIYLALGDCTGHGVPGAMLSIFVISMLNQIVSNLDDETPAGILDKLDKLMQKYLSQYTELIRDSAEISMIKYDITNQKIIYSGAKRPLVHVRNGVLKTYDGAKYVLGNNHRRKELVQNIEIQIQEKDMLFMFSDGFSDQFGGEKNTKFSTKRLINLLQHISPLTIQEQSEQIQAAYFNWKGNNSQIDDVVLLGICI